MEMTDEERKSILPSGIWLKAKCDNCGRPLGAKLFYRGARGEYCSDSCLQEAADLPEFRTKRRKVMIKKKSMQNKASVPPADKAKKKTTKTKEAKTAPAPKTEAKTAPAPKRHGTITNSFRPGSIAHTALQRLLDRGPLPMSAIFEGLSTADPGRLLVDIRYRGAKEGFELKRDNEGRYAVVPA